MIRNVALKRFLVDKIFPVFSLVNKFTRKKENQIFLYCAANGDLSDNSEALFDYMVANNYNRKYRIVCGVNDPGEYKDRISQNISFVPKRQCIKEYLRSKYVFYSFGKLPIKPTKDQCVINLCHGITCKAPALLSNINNGKEFFFSYICASSEMYRPIMAKAFGCPEENVCICGDPKADRLFEEKKDLGYKLIVWTPTFRQSKYLGYNDSSAAQLLPLFEQDEWEDLNRVLEENGVKLVVKLHPRQDVGEFTHCENFSNLAIYSGAYFLEKKQNLYSLLAQSDALISDYSSVYLEYLLLNRPICFMLGDMQDYSDTRGFAFENPLDFMPGEHVRDKQDLYKFIRDVANGRDPHKQKRENVRDLVHQYKDNKNCKRILDIAGIEV